MRYLGIEDGKAFKPDARMKRILTEGAAEVLDGLAEGDLVIVRGQYLVGDGDRVRYEAAEDAAEAA